ncbi:chromosome segregation DNA-binding protein [Jannaschia pagri]|uniref:Chromosome segregation DNA-binding protein n=1 Tax=Jannaschia pagri TaxID=2829797 RepID=A0ABQ4NLJ2_9RHOB|nr:MULTISPECIES: ParB/RepB/Spo0J family partition protein [unclassified Jannaschia]GIT91453.1 chromosome segregation DNA-binding protein [Jannaschia sp. AI_61]GIT95287.1 chromosome segregation DNA-binding protein [Jannaschia sp. AI_62]
MSDVTGKRPMRRGLSALMADMGVDATDASAQRSSPDRSVPIDLLSANPNQPRRTFDEEKLSDLASSIATKGVLQPLIVRPRHGSTESYEIVAGERRWRAAQRCGLHSVPVIIRDFDDTEVLEVAIVENIQRDDLNAIEEALGFRQLIDKFGHTQDQLSEVLGKSRSHVTNLLRLLKLPPSVQDLLRDGQISAGHARALINSDDPSSLAALVVKNGLSVRETERLAKAAKSESTGNTTRATRPAKDADTLALEGDLTAALGLYVQIKHKPGDEGGDVSIRYKSLDQLDALCEVLSQGLKRD